MSQKSILNCDQISAGTRNIHIIICRYGGHRVMNFLRNFKKFDVGK